MADFPSSDKALDLLNTLARTLANGQTTGGLNIIVSSTDQIQGEDAAAGLILSLRGGDSSAGNNPGGTARLQGGAGDGSGDGGNVLVRPGVSGGSGEVGFVQVTNNGADDDRPILRLTSEGANAATVHLYTGTRDPTGAVSALAAGDLYIRNDGTMYQASAAGPGSWTALGGGGIAEQVDSFGSALTTGNATASGGTVDFTVAVGVPYGELKHLRVVANGTCADCDVQFFRDSARTDEIYALVGGDPSTQLVDRNPGTMRGDDGSALESNTLYGRITNNDAGDSTFDVELTFWG